MVSAEASSKPCHNCRRQRLRCDRSYPHCNKCTNAGKECLGYGKLFRWTGAVASRGKLAGRSSSAPVVAAGGQLGQDSSAHSPKYSHSTPESMSQECHGSPSSSSLCSDRDRDRGCPSDMQLVSSRSSSVESELKTPYILVDPLYQDLGESHRYYLSYCM